MATKTKKVGWTFLVIISLELLKKRFSFKVIFRLKAPPSLVVEFTLSKTGKIISRFSLYFIESYNALL